MLENFYTRILQNNERFTQHGSANGEENTLGMLPAILAMITIDIILLLIGKFLWNGYLAPAVTAINPIGSFIDLLAIKILLRLLLN